MGVGSTSTLRHLTTPTPPPHRGREQQARLPLTPPCHAPTYGLRPYRPHGRLHGHGLNALGLDPARLILVETAHRKETLWAMEEAVRSAAPAAVVGVIDTLDLKLSQRLHLAATDAGLPAFFAAAGADAGIERGGDALAHRPRESRARPFRPRHAAALAFATRALPQRTAG